MVGGNILVLIQKKETKPKRFLKKNFDILLNISFFGKMTENDRNRVKAEFIKKMTKRKLLSNNQNYHSVVFINHMKIVIAIHLGKTNFLGINQYT